MNLAPLSVFWLQLIGLLAAELGLTAAILWLLLRRNASARWRRTCCQAAIMATLVIALGELSGANRGLARWMAPSGSPASADEIGSNPLPAPAPVLDPAFTAKVNARLATLPPTEPQPALSGTGALPGVTSATPVPSRLARAEIARPRLGLWLLALWAAGMAVVGGRVCLIRCLLVLFWARGRAVIDAPLLSRIQALSRSLGVLRSVRVIESSQLKSPIAFGVLRPTIALPQNFKTTFDPRQQQVILAHELAHLAARDPVWYWLADLATALFWWHPAAWWMRRQLHCASEWAADEASLLVDEGPRALAECLVELGARLSGAAVPGQLRIEGFRSNLGWRVQRLLNLENRAWSPPRRFSAALIQSLGPLALTLTLITCTAWTLPRAVTEGETMKNMPLTWKRSFAALGIIIGLGAEITTVSAEPPASEVGKVTTQPTAQTPPAGPNSFQRYGLSGSAPAEGAQANPATAAADPAAAQKFRQRYGLSSAPAMPPAGVPGPELPRQGVQLEAKLKQIVLDEVRLDGLPISEVLNMLSEEAHKRDATKKGINFLINPNLPTGHPVVPYIDPSTGLAMAVPTAESFDLASVTVRFSLPLRNVTMKDVLDAIVKVADKPIEYTLEDYAVVFSPRPEAGAGSLVRTPPAMPEMLAVRTFKVNTNTFVAGLENAFGISIDKSTGAKASGVRRALNDLLTQLGITIEANKSVFYNELTGVVMVRATEEDLQVVRAAIETLGGAVYEQALSRTQ